VRFGLGARELVRERDARRLEPADLGARGGEVLIRLGEREEREKRERSPRGGRMVVTRCCEEGDVLCSLYKS